MLAFFLASVTLQPSALHRAAPQRTLRCAGAQMMLPVNDVLPVAVSSVSSAELHAAASAAELPAFVLAKSGAPAG